MLFLKRAIVSPSYRLPESGLPPGGAVGNAESTLRSVAHLLVRIVEPPVAGKLPFRRREHVESPGYTPYRLLRRANR